MKMTKYIIGCFFTVLCIHMHAQEPNDCVGAITVCGNGTFMSNATGSGNEFEVNSCSGFEHNSLWLQVNIVQSGTLGFDLIPNDPDINVDYDFWVYGPNVPCNNLGNPIRCATTNPNLAGLPNNHTGINGSTTLTQTGPGANGNGYVYWLNVTAGESYFIAIDRPHGDGGFEIQWTGTAMDGTGAFPSPPQATQIDDVIQCSSTPDVSIFDLNAIKSSINPDLVNNTVEFYGNLADATDAVNPLGGGFGIYANTENPEQIYARVTSGVTDCYSLIDFNLIVSPIPSATVTSSDTVVCEGETVTFTISGTPNATISYNINGGTSQQVLLDASGQGTVIETLIIDTDINLTEAEVINGSGQVVCSQILTDSTSVTVNPSVTPTFTPVAAICEGDALAPLPTTSDNGVTGSWSPALDNTATTTYTFTPDAGQCSVTETMTITVNPSVTPTFTPVAAICEGDALAPLPTTSDNGVTGSWSPALDNTATTTYTFIPDAGQCGESVFMDIVVNMNPVIDLDELSVCSPNTTGYHQFDLISEIPSILGGTQNQTDYTVDFFEDPAMTSQITTNPYNNTSPFSQTIYVLITNSNSGCSELFPFELTVESAATATMPDPVVICDSDGTNDGISTYDLTVLDSEILNGQNPNNFTVSYYFSSQDAIDDNNAIIDPTNFQNTIPNNQTIHIRVSNNDIPEECYAISSVEVSVNPILNPEIYSQDGTNTICVDYETNTLQNQITLISDIQGPNYTYTWYLDGVEIVGANQAAYVVDTVSPGDYTVSVTETLPTANCPSTVSAPFEIVQSGQAVLVNVSQSGTFAPNPSVTVTVEGYGEYWFQMDDGPILDNGGVFTNVSGGLHTVYVYDRKTENPSCGFITVDNIRIIDYPKVITPNHDGDNDTWNVYAFSGQPNATINIYDRYGKVLANIKPSGPGWDGTYKGNDLPSSDYWFVLSYVEDGQPKQFRSHFSLKR